MSLQNINRNLNNAKNISKNTATSNVSLTIQGKEFFITKSRLKKIAKGFAKFAHLNGETNDEKKYAEDLEEDLTEALKLLEEKRKSKSKK